MIFDPIIPGFTGSISVSSDNAQIRLIDQYMNNVPIRPYTWSATPQILDSTTALAWTMLTTEELKKKQEESKPPYNFLDNLTLTRD